MNRDVVAPLSPDLAFGGSSGRLCVLILTSLAVCLMCWSDVVAGPRLTWVVASVPLVIPIFVAYAAMKERGIWDPTVLFPAFFGIYNGLILVRLLSADVRSRLAYPVKFVDETFFRAGLFSALAAVSLALTWCLWKPIQHRRISILDVTTSFYVGLICYVLGLLMYLLQYFEIGGYWAALAMNRVKRFEVMTTAISLPYFSFVLVGLVLMVIAGTTVRKRILTVALSALWCILVMAQGDRRLFLQAVFAVASAATFVGARSTRIKLRHIVLALVAFLGLSAFGALRQQIPSLLGHVHRQVISASSDDSSLLDSAKPENSELAGPLLSVLYNAEHVREYSLGASYVISIFTLLPRFLYPAKPPAPAAELAIQMHHGGTHFPVAGWGYSPIAEAFLNFGIPGVCLIFSCWMSAFVLLSRLRNYKWGLVTAAVLSSEALNVNRIDFRTVYLESVSCLVCVALAALMVRVLQR